jgi:hypothetical protein
MKGMGAIPALSTVGHCNHAFDRFIEMLDADQLARSLPSHGFQYGTCQGSADGAGLAERRLAQRVVPGYAEYA